MPVTQCDVIVSSDVLEHIDDDTAVLRNFFTALTYGGTLVLHVPNTNQHNYLGRYGGKHRDTEGHMRDGYLNSELAAKLSAAGFEILGLKYTCGSIGELGIELYRAIRSQRFPLACLFLLLLCLSYLDALGVNPGRRGNGLLFAARKPSSTDRAR